MKEGEKEKRDGRRGGTKTNAKKDKTAIKKRKRTRKKRRMLDEAQQLDASDI